MLDIFRMNQVFLFRVLIVIFLEMVNLILVLVIAVMSGTVTKIRQFDALRVTYRKLCEGDRPTLIAIVEREDLLYSLVLVVLRDVVRAFVFEAVGFEDVFGCPFVTTVVVVEVEEGARVEGGYVMLLCSLLAIAVDFGLGNFKVRTCHMSSRPICVWRDWLLLMTAMRLRIARQCRGD